MPTSTATSASLTGGPTPEQLTLFPAASPASPSVQPESEKARQTTATSGRRCFELSERLGRPGLLAKTLLASSAWTAGAYSTKYSLIWKARGIRLKHLLFQLAPLERPTAATGFGLLPTPATMDTGENQSVEDFRARQARLKEKNKGRTGNGCGPGISMALKIAGLLPTPQSRDFRSVTGRELEQRENALQNLNVFVGMLPTPTARDHKSEKASPETMERNARPLSETFGAKTGWKLQPAFVEYMMGYPEGWTELND
jgi:hypothetical protein